MYTTPVAPAKRRFWAAMSAYKAPIVGKSGEAVPARHSWPIDIQP
jgi:hypothetical protein